MVDHLIKQSLDITMQREIMEKSVAQQPRKKECKQRPHIFQVVWFRSASIECRI